MIIRPLELSDASAWEAMRRDLWPDGAADHAREITAFFAGGLDEPKAVLIVQQGASLVDELLYVSRPLLPRYLAEILT